MEDDSVGQVVSLSCLASNAFAQKSNSSATGEQPVLPFTSPYEHKINYRVVNNCAYCCNAHKRLSSTAGARRCDQIPTQLDACAVIRRVL